MKATTRVATIKAHHAFMNSFTNSPKGIWTPVITEEDAIEAREVDGLAIGDISVSMPRTMLASIFQGEWDRHVELWIGHLNRSDKLIPSPFRRDALSLLVWYGCWQRASKPVSSRSNMISPVFACCEGKSPGYGISRGRSHSVLFMSKHHHHPHEGHGEGNPPGTARGHLRHNWFFYVSGVFLFIALLAFVLTGSLAWRPPVATPPPAPAAGTAK